ncbi:MAG: DNA translocase FtsK 4TM domain-containing protein [Bacteroides sp.]
MRHLQQGLKQENMSKENKNNISKTTVQAEESKIDERALLLIGLFVLLCSLFVLLAMFSHLFSWATDQSLSWENIFSPADFETANILGPAGARIASALVTHGFGLGAFLLPLLLFMYGLRILRVQFKHWWKRQFLLIFGCVLSSLWLGFIFRGTWGILGYGLGGKFGYFVSGWLIGFMRYIGAGFVLFLATVAFLVWLRPLLAHTFFNLLQLSGRGVLARMQKVGLQTAQKENDLQFDAEEKEQQAKANDATQEGEVATQETETTKPGTPLTPDTEETSLQENIPPAVQNPLLPSNLTTPQQDSPALQIIRPEQTAETPTTLEVVRTEAEENAIKHFTVDEPYDPTLDLSHYQMPPLSLLEEYEDEQQEVSKEELEANNEIIVKALLEFDIHIKSIRATVGPTVTLYEIIPGQGVKVTKIEGLEKDLALRLQVLGVRIFMRPGAIGIEVPNKKSSIVSMLSMLRSKKFQEHSGALPLALGKTVSGEPYVVDLEKMPHLLVAGATGQGKSVGLNVIIASILYKCHPAQVKLVMVDPKKVEFSPYAKLEKYFLAKLPEEEEAIITDSEKVIFTLNSLVQEMEGRLTLLRDAQVRKISEYNEKFVARRLNPEKGHSYMPRIVIIIDEFADLMMTSSNDVVPPLMRLAQVGRAAGIHLIMATQRPTTDVLVGKIKANIPARIAFRVVSGIDSRTILEMQGAEKLIGNGDMLVRVDSLTVERVQCAFLDTKEVARITEYISTQQSYPSAWFLPEPPASGEGSASDENFSGGDLDPLFEEVKEFVISEGTCSISTLQRKFEIGFPRAARIVDQLEKAGIVGAKRGTKEREVLI